MDKVELFVFTCCGDVYDYSPFIVIERLETCCNNVLTCGDSTHDPGYSDYVDGYIKAFDSFSEYLPEICIKKIDINNKKYLDKYEDFLRLGSVYEQFRDMIEMVND